MSFGKAYAFRAARTENHYQVVDGMNAVRGRHQFGFGASAQAVQLDANLANRFAGILLFPTVADFVRGTPDVKCGFVGRASIQHLESKGFDYRICLRMLDSHAREL